METMLTPKTPLADGLSQLWKPVGGLALLAGCVVALQLGWATAQRRDVRLPVPVVVQASPGDLSFGRPEAGVTIVALLSLTCGHCRQWANDNLVPLLAGPVAAGQARLVLRPFPLDTPSLDGAAMLACLSPAKGVAALTTLLRSPATLGASGVAGMAALAGVPAGELAAVEACAAEQKPAVLKSVQAAQQAWGVKVTPTFLVGQHLVTGARPAAELVQMVAQEASLVPPSGTP